MKRFLLCMTFMLTASMSRISAYDFKAGGICYNVIMSADGTQQAEVTNDDAGYYSGEVCIPESVNYNGRSFPVARIGDSAFRAYNEVVPIGDETDERHDSPEDQGGHGLTAVTIPGTVTVIGNNAFEFCSGLSSVTLGTGISDIGAFSFFGCESLKEVILPSSVRQIGIEAFGNCTALTSMVLNEGLVSIQHDAFGFCSSLSSINIPSTVRGLESSVFTGCTSLTSVVIHTAECGNWFKGNQSIKEVALGASVSRMADSAFEYCTNLENITATENLCSIGDKALYGTAWLETQPQGPLYLGRVLYSCKGELLEKNVVVKDGTMSISDHAFDGCTDLMSVTIPTSVSEIGKSAFSGCASLRQLSIPSSVTVIGEYAFKGCTSLELIKLPENLTTLAMGLFKDCSNLHDICLPQKLCRIEASVFRNCSRLKSIILPKQLTAIGKEAFRDCKSLTSIIIPSAITEIGQMAFYADNQLATVISMTETPCTVHRSVFGMTENITDVTLYIPSGTKEAYVTAGWTQSFTNIIEKDINELSTGFNSKIVNSKSVTGQCFDLAGRRLTAPSSKGVYIMDGKKVAR